MLDVQRHLQADRHVEVLQKQNRKDQGEVEQQDVGAGRTQGDGRSAKPR
jgi:hypothetical protein